jgi:hypothetical protein
LKGEITMKKYYLTNNDITEITYFNSNEEALKEARRRNQYDKYANWKAWNEYGEAIYEIVTAP